MSLDVGWIKLVELAKLAELAGLATAFSLHRKS
jgi:hypothetical protein